MDAFHRIARFCIAALGHFIIYPWLMKFFKKDLSGFSFLIKFPLLVLLISYTVSEWCSYSPLLPLICILSICLPVTSVAFLAGCVRPKITKEITHCFEDVYVSHCNDMWHVYLFNMCEANRVTRRIQNFQVWVHSSTMQESCHSTLWPPICALSKSHHLQQVSLSFMVIWFDLAFASYLL